MFLRAFLVLCLLVGMLPSAVVEALAQSRLQEFLTKVSPGDFVPGADAFAVPVGNPPLAPVLAAGRTVGYAFVNSDWVNSTGYSGKPIEILVGLSTDGKIAGARLMDHHEPIVLIGIPPERIANFIKGYVGRDVLQIATNGPSARPEVDIVSGATVTVTVIADSMIRSAIRVARAMKVGGASTAAAAVPVREIDPAHSAPQDWTGMLGDGSVRRLSLSVGEVTEAFRRAGNNEAAANPEASDPAATFIDLYAALVSVPAIGKRLLGEDGFAALQSSLKPEQQTILIASNGLYSFKGSGYVRGGIFDRFEVIQGDAAIRFRDRTHSRVGALQVSGAPEFHEVDLFRIPEGATLDPTEAWRLQLLVQRSYGARDKAFLTFNLGYELPQPYLKQLPAAAPVAPPQTSPAAELNEPPLWHAMWWAKLDQIAILLVALTFLTGVFFFQDWFASRPRLYEGVRLGFLVFTLFWLGWYAQAQLSVVNVLAFLNALRTDFRWEYFLMAPLIFILWFATAAAMLFWNRGAFCGWLCPFGVAGTAEPDRAPCRHTAIAHPVQRSFAVGSDQIHHLPGVVRRLPQRAGDRRKGRRG
jgi:NosR/NirI family transcriptional regulator, nitrous oxide reductase regulator